MSAFNIVQVPEAGEEVYEVSLAGDLLINNSLLNKGSAFTDDERREFGLLGLLPAHVSTMGEQVARNYENYKRKENDLERYIFLVSLQERNETLYYRLLGEHITEMMPIIYTPVVGVASQTYSHIYRRPRGLYIPFTHRAEIDSVLRNAPHADVEVIVVTDGERILGLGDLGVGGMGIPVGKLALYTLCAGISPATTLPVLLDVGTNNQELIDDPLYLGWRHERVRGQEYDDFIESFVNGVIKQFPNALLQWEDFAKDNATRLLELYRDRLTTFNDDIQGTGAVTLAGLLAAMRVTGAKIGKQRIVMFGAGSSASGISDQIVAAAFSEGVPVEETRQALWLIDHGGLVHSERRGLEPFKQRYAQPVERFREWSVERPDHISLKDVVRNVHPTILIGTSAQPGAFTEEIVREMAAHTERPIIFPLSNPTSKSEATPEDLIRWTEGRALVATGSPFADVVYRGRVIRVGQCNNVFIFPGVGLGVLASRARRVTNEMFVAAARALAEFSPALSDPDRGLFPAPESVREVSRRVAEAVGREAMASGLAPETGDEELSRRVAAKMWTPRYVRYRRKPVV
jgi:malate dehydrogenase (oxaloacetate-decarboxylating)